MYVLILAGGYGTRLYPLVTDTPKSLLDVAGKPLLARILDKVCGLPDVSGIFIVTNAKFSGQFEAWVETQKDFSVPMTIVNDGTATPDERLGSVGDIQYVLDNVNVDQDLLVIGGDNVFDYALDPYIEFCQKRNAPVVGLYDIGSLEDARRFGVVDIDQDRKIISFEEKPQNPQSTLIAMCSYYFPKEILGSIKKYLEQTGKADKAGEYIKWLSQIQTVYGFEFQGMWYDIGSIESLKDACAYFSEKD